MIGDKRIRHLTKVATLSYIPTSDYGKNGDKIYVKDDKTNSTEEFVKQDGSWISLLTGRGAIDGKRRAGKRGTSSASATTIQNITVNQAESTGEAGTVVNHNDLLELDDDDHTQYVHNTTARTVSASHLYTGNPNFSGQPSFTKAGTPFTVTGTTKVSNLNVDQVDGKQPGTGVGDIAYYDGNNRVADSQLVDGKQPGIAAADIAYYDGNTRVVDSALFLGQDDTVFFKLADDETVSGRPAFDGGASGVSSPFTVDSTYEVARLNAAALSGADWDAPLAIGSTTATTGKFTTLTGTTLDVNGSMTITGGITGDHASANLAITSTNGDITVEGTTFSGDNVIIPGNLTVTGETVTSLGTTVQIEDKNMYLAYNNTVGDNETLNLAADSGGISLKAAEDKHFIWINSTDRWTASEDLESSGLYLKTNSLTKISLHDIASDAMTYIQTTNAGDMILKAPSSQGIGIDADNHFGGTTFVSGFAGSGWRVTKDAANEYNAEFDNLTVRGTMSVYELLIQQIRATNGSLMVTSADKVLEQESLGSGIYKFTIEADDTTDFIHFTDDDLIIAQKWAGTSGDPPYDPVKRVRATVTETSLSTITTEPCTYTFPDNIRVTHIANPLIVQGLAVSGTNIKPGSKVDVIISTTAFDMDKETTGSGFAQTLTFKSALNAKEFKVDLYSTDSVSDSDLPLDFVRIGNTSDGDRQGGVYITSEDSGAPFIDIFNDVSDWTHWRAFGICLTAAHTDRITCEAAHDDNWVLKTKARLGKLTGITHEGTNLTGYGLYSENVFLTGKITATSGYIGTQDQGWAITSDKISNGNFVLNANAETLQLGSVTSFANDTNTKSGVFMGLASAGKYDFFVGKETLQYLHYDDDAGTLKIKGTIQLSDGTEVVGAGVNWLSAYASGTTYAVNDGVSYLSASYICKLASTGNVPTNTTYWDLMADQGGQGVQGHVYKQFSVFRNAANASAAGTPSGGAVNSSGNMTTEPTHWALLQSSPSASNYTFVSNSTWKQTNGTGDYSLTGGNAWTAAAQVSGATGATPSNGVDARAITLTPTQHTINYSTAGVEATTIVFSTDTYNTDGTLTYQFEVNPDGEGYDVTQAYSSTTSYTLADGDEPAIGSSISVKVTLKEDGVAIANDAVTIYAIQDGADAATIVSSNEAHTLPVTAVPVVDYDGSGTDIRVWSGATALAYGTGNSQFSVSVSDDTNITVDDNPSTVSTYTRRYGDHKLMTEDTASITYDVSVKDSAGTATVFTKTQTFAKSHEGSQGIQGIQGVQGIQGNDNQDFTFANELLSTVDTDPAIDAGLLMTSEVFGFHNGIALNATAALSDFNTYMDASGNFYLTGTGGSAGGSLSWISGTSTLQISGGITVTNPTDFANPNAFGLNSCSLVLNTRASDGNQSSQNGEAAIVKIDQDGTPVYGENGFIIYQGEQYSVPHVAATGTHTVLTGMINVTGFIAFNVEEASFYVFNEDRQIALVWRDAASSTGWYYDNNGTSGTEFTPGEEHIAIGWIRTHLTSSDGVLRAGALFDPVVLEDAAFEVPGLGTKSQTFIQSNAPSAITIGDLWIDSDDMQMYRASAVGTGNWVLAINPDENTTTIIDGTVTTNFVNALSVNAATVSAGWVYAGALTAGQIQTAGSAFRPTLSYVFRSSQNDFSVFNGTFTNNDYYTRITHTSPDAGIRTPDDLRLDGELNRYIKIRFRRNSGTGWDGSVYWEGDAGGEHSTRRLDFADPTDGTVSAEWSIVLLDMYNLTAGGDDWKDDEQIERIRIDFGDATGNAFDIDFIMIGDLSADTAGTYIDSSGVYTGTLTATQVNAVNITANTIDMDSATVSGTLAAANIDVSGVVTATNVNAVDINADSITAGTLTGRTVATSDGATVLDNSSDFGNLSPTETVINTQFSSSGGYTVPTSNPSSLAYASWSSSGTVCIRFDLKCTNIDAGGVDYGIAKVVTRVKLEGTWQNFGSAQYVNFISDGFRTYEFNYGTASLVNYSNILLLITENIAPGFAGGGYGGGSGTETSELKIRYYKNIVVQQKTEINKAGFRTYATSSNYAKFGGGGNYFKGATTIHGNLSCYGEAFKLTGGSWLSTSDERIKNIKSDYKKGLSTIKDIDIVNYEYKHDPGKEYIGVVAQRLENALPEAVSEKVSMGYDDLKVINESPVLWTLVNAVKELSDEVDKVKKRCKCGRK